VGQEVVDSDYLFANSCNSLRFIDGQGEPKPAVGPVRREAAFASRLGGTNAGSLFERHVGLWFNYREPLRP